MFATVKTIALDGVTCIDVDVQVQLANGLPAFTIVGLADKAVSESRERVRGALQSLGLALPPKRLTVNLSPADLTKIGSHYDLPIALALLATLEVIDPAQLNGLYALGELSLDGALRPVSGVLPAALHASGSDAGIVCPAANADEAAWGLNPSAVKAADSLLQLINHFKRDLPLTPVARRRQPVSRGAPDISAVKGQVLAKRAIEIAAAAGHNFLMVGPPGAGKSLLAAVLPGLLPQLSPAEMLEVSMIHSVAGEELAGGLITERPFRAPHHSASQVAMVGGGQRVRPGEVTLAHRGVLFLDELPEFPRGALEALRQPLETREVAVARANAHVTYPANVQLLAAMNPCRCGHLADPARACSKAPRCGEDYINRVSGPLLDRFDIVVEVGETSARELLSNGGTSAGDTSAEVQARVSAARVIQLGRYQDEENTLTNADLSAQSVEAHTQLSAAARETLIEAADQMGLSGRGFHRVMKVARTIADLADSALVERAHISEALSYRRHRFT